MSAVRTTLPFPEAPVYLFYGNQIDQVLAARDQVLDALLDPETRNENLTDYGPASNHFGVELKKLMPEIAGDLDTMSFIPGAKKIAVVTNPLELYGRSAGGGRRKKSSKSGKAAAAPESEESAWQWLERALPGTGNHLVLLALEDEADGREVNEKNPLLQLIGRIGYFQRFRDKKAFWRIEETLVRRDATRCLEAIRSLWKSDKGAQTVYSAVVRSVRYMLQANIARERRVGHDSVKLELYFPARAQFSLFKASQFVQDRYTSRPIPYRTAALLEAYERLAGVYQALRPSPTDLFVPDARELTERILLELFASPRPGGR